MLSGTRRAFSRRSILSPWTRPTSFAPASITPTRAFATGFIEEEKAVHVHNLLKAKKEARLTFDEIAAKTGLTNAYVAQVESKKGWMTWGESREGHAGGMTPQCLKEPIEYISRYLFALEEQTIADVCHHPSLILFFPFPFHYGSSFTDKPNSSPRRCPRWRPPYPH